MKELKRTTSVYVLIPELGYIIGSGPFSNGVCISPPMIYFFPFVLHLSFTSLHSKIQERSSGRFLSRGREFLLGYFLFRSFISPVCPRTDPFVWVRWTLLYASFFHIFPLSPFANLGLRASATEGEKEWNSSPFSEVHLRFLQSSRAFAAMRRFLEMWLRAEKRSVKFTGSSVLIWTTWLFSKFYKKLSSISRFSVQFT